VKTLMISDLHLDDERPELTEILVRFLRGDARSAHSLYLLGDIFEAWVGDDDDAPLVDRVARELRAVADSGVKVFFMHGNRDFLLGNTYADRAGFEILNDPTVVELGGIRTLLSHGDRYCTADLEYQAFRKQSRDPLWQKGVLGMPLAARRGLAAQARQKSMQRQKELGPLAEITDVADAAVIADLEQAGVERVIHGHTHRPNSHQLTLGSGRSAERIVLSDWRTTGEAFEVKADGSYQRHELR